MVKATSMRYFTWCDRRANRRARIFLESCKLNDISCNVLDCSALSEKPVALARALIGLPEDMIAVCCDAFDVLCAAGSNKLFEDFGRFKCDILFGSEKLCFHHLERSISAFNLKYPGSGRCYLNSGMFMGRVGAIREMLATICNWNFGALEQEFATGREIQGFFNDQTVFGAYFSEFPEAMALDIGSAVFWNITGDLPLSKDCLVSPSGSIFNEVSGTNPSYVHFTRLREVTYLLFLRTASEMGIPLRSHNCDSDLIRSFLSKLSDMQHLPYGIADSLAHELSAIPSVRSAKLLAEFRDATVRLRKDLGKCRRSLDRWFRSVLHR